MEGVKKLPFIDLVSLLVPELFLNPAFEFQLGNCCVALLYMKFIMSNQITKPMNVILVKSIYEINPAFS